MLRERRRRSRRRKRRNEKKNKRAKPEKRKSNNEYDVLEVIRPGTFVSSRQTWSIDH